MKGFKEIFLGFFGGLFFHFILSFFNVDISVLFSFADFLPKGISGFILMGIPYSLLVGLFLFFIRFLILLILKREKGGEFFVFRNILLGAYLGYLFLIFGFIYFFSTANFSL